MKIRATKNETVGKDLLEMMLRNVTDHHPYPRCWWHDPFPRAQASSERQGWSCVLTSVYSLMAGVDVTCGKGAGPEPTYSICSALSPPSMIWEVPPMNTTALVSKSSIAPRLRTAKTDQEKRTGGLPITQDACLAFPWIPQSSSLLGRVAISFARQSCERSKASVLQLSMRNYASS